MSASENDWAKKLSQELGRDKKKTFILAALLLVGVIVGVRTLGKSGPDEASAAPVMSEGEMVIESLIPEQVGLPATAESAEAARRTDDYIKAIDHNITRDLFVFDPAGFTPLALEQPRTDEAPTDAPVETTDWSALINEQIARLTLQSTINSDMPLVMINGRVLGAGEMIDGFEVVEIRSGECILTKKGVEVTLKMQRQAP